MSNNYLLFISMTYNNTPLELPNTTPWNSNKYKSIHTKAIEDIILENIDHHMRNKASGIMMYIAWTHNISKAVEELQEFHTTIADQWQEINLKQTTLVANIVYTLQYLLWWSTWADSRIWDYGVDLHPTLRQSIVCELAINYHKYGQNLTYSYEIQDASHLIITLHNTIKHNDDDTPYSSNLWLSHIAQYLAIAQWTIATESDDTHYTTKITLPLRQSHMQQ